MKTTKDKVSYCIGLETGRNLVRQFDDVDFENLKKGFLDALLNNTPELPDNEVQAFLHSLKVQIEQQQRQFIANLSENNRKEGETFLEENKKREGVIVLNSGLQYEILQKGTGVKPSFADTVSVHYRGYFINGSIFDSSYERNQPQVFPLQRVISGWSEMLQLMQVGEKVKMYVPHYLAYGDAGFGNEIQPCMTLVFEMELLAVNPESAV